MLRKNFSEAPWSVRVDVVDSGETAVLISIVHGSLLVGSAAKVWRARGGMRTGCGSLAVTVVVLPSRVNL